MNINPQSAVALKQLEELLVSERTSVKSALETACMLGYHQGVAEMADKALKDLRDLGKLLPKVPA